MDDVRDLTGRLRRLATATVIGLVIALTITFALPTRDHFPGPVGGCGFSHPEQGWIVEGGDPVLIGVGGIVLANFGYVVLVWRAKRRRLLPVARLVR